MVQNCRAVTVDTSGLEEGQLVTLISGSEGEMIIKKVPADRTESTQHFQFQLTDGGEGSMTVNTGTVQYSTIQYRYWVKLAASLNLHAIFFS